MVLFHKLTQRFGIKWRAVFPALAAGLIGLMSVIYIIQTLTFRFAPAYRGDLSLAEVIGYTMDYGVNWPLVQMCVILIFVLVLIAVWKRRDLLKRDSDRNIHYSNRENYGSARPMDSREMAGIARIQTQEQATGPIFGQMDKSGKRLIVGQMDSRYNNHVCVFGASGSGKTTSIIKPAIIQTCKRRESMILTDPKGELFRDSVQYLRDNGYEIRRFDLVNLDFSDGWDCMGEIRGNYERSQIFAQIVMQNISSERRNIFYHQQTALLTAVLLRVSQGSDYEGRRTFGEAYRIINRHGAELERVFDINTHPEIMDAVDAYNSFKQASPNAYGNIVSGLSTMLGVLQSKLVQRITGEARIDTLLPGMKPCAYFLVLSDKHPTYRFLSSLFFSFLFMDLMDFADLQDDGALPVPVNFLLDEVRNIGQIPDLDIKMATIRSRAINVTLVLQSLSQIQLMYPETWSDILNNCAVQIGLGFNDEATAKYFSDRSGEATIQVQTEQHEPYESIFRLSRQHSTGEGKRYVYTADELQRLGVDDVIIVFQGRNVLKARKFPVFAHSEYRNWRKTDVFHTIPPISDTNARQIYYEADDRRVREYEVGHSILNTLESQHAQEASSVSDTGSHSISTESEKAPAMECLQDDALSDEARTSASDFAPELDAQNAPAPEEPQFVSRFRGARPVVRADKPSDGAEGDPVDVLLHTVNRQKSKSEKVPGNPTEHRDRSPVYDTEHFTDHDGILIYKP